MRSNVVLGIGSNLGDRVNWIHAAFNALIASGKFKLVNTSRLYQTIPRFQPKEELDLPYLNAAAALKTNLSADQVLVVIKKIEENLGRDLNKQRYSSREIDLDILFYENSVLDMEMKKFDLGLQVPHPEIEKREFVLGPLLDLNPEFMHPKLNRTISHLWDHLSSDKKSSIFPVFPIRSKRRFYQGNCSDKVFPLGKKTFIMGILNVTPDSFSDGGKYNVFESAFEYARDMIHNGADIIDIGGCSTRPNAKIISAEEEIERIMPVIEAIRKEFPDIPISADTFRPEVAQIALDFGGVDIINDVSGGLCVESNSEKESKMFEVVAERNAPIIIMHYRGNPSTMLQKAVYQSNNLIEVVAQELEGRISKALDAGIPLWNIVIDPGIGFAKNESHNFEMLSKASVFKSRFQNIPMLIGTSRKGFIGKTVGSNNIEDRDWGTAATVCASIIGGADFIRVHNVKGMSSVCKVGDRLWRNQN